MIYHHHHYLSPVGNPLTTSHPVERCSLPDEEVCTSDCFWLDAEKYWNERAGNDAA